jgi:hypothetical protein
MPNLNDLDRKLEQLQQELLKEGPNIVQTVAVNALALSKLRIQKTGVKGKQYSTKEMLATASQFNRKQGFKPTEIEFTEIGRIGQRNQVAGGFRQPGTGRVDRKGAERKKRWLWIKFKGAKKAVPVMVLPGGYKQLRQLNGLQTGYVDLTFSGRMFQNIKLLAPINKRTKFTAFIGATDKENRDKVRGLSIRFGQFLDPEKSELAILSDIQNNKIREIIKRVMG